MSRPERPPEEGGSEQARGSILFGSRTAAKPLPTMGLPHPCPETSGCDQYRALLAVSQAIVSHRDLSALFHDLAGRLHQVVRFDYLALVLHEAATNTMRCTSWRPCEPPPGPRDRSSGRRRPGGVGVADPAAADHSTRGPS